MKKINIIVATDSYGIIGHGLEIPFILADDMTENFVPKTKGCPLIMGPNTARGLPGGTPLKNRTCIVISRNGDFKTEGFIVVLNLWEALAVAEQAPGETIWIGGGGVIYKIALEKCVVDEIHLTKVHNTYPAKNAITFCGFNHSLYRPLPEKQTFQKRAPKTNTEKDRGNSDAFHIEIYKRISSIS